MSSKGSWDLGLQSFPAEVSLSKTQFPYWGYSYATVSDVADFLDTLKYNGSIYI